MSEPKFALSEGTGTALGKLPCFTTVKRGKATKELENALEPLHRIVYGRPGQSGERKANLEEFKGFPVTMEAEVQEKLSNLTKDKLRAMIVSLGMRVLISQSHAQVVEGVLAFLMKPKDEGKIKSEKSKSSASEKKRARSASVGGRNQHGADGSDGDEYGDAEASEAAAVEEEEPPKQVAKRARTEESTVVKASAPAPAAARAGGPSDDAVRVQVYRRVLTMTPEERRVLGVKQLRTELESHFKVKDGELKRCKELIAETASDCVRALMDAEARARDSLAQATPPIAVKQVTEEKVDSAGPQETAAPHDVSDVASPPS